MRIIFHVKGRWLNTLGCVFHNVTFVVVVVVVVVVIVAIAFNYTFTEHQTICINITKSTRVLLSICLSSIQI